MSTTVWRRLWLPSHRYKRRERCQFQPVTDTDRRYAARPVPARNCMSAGQRPAPTINTRLRAPGQIVRKATAIGPIKRYLHLAHQTVSGKDRLFDHHILHNACCAIPQTVDTVSIKKSKSSTAQDSEREGRATAMLAVYPRHACAGDST